MPLIESLAFRSPRYMLNGHFQTIIPSSFRKVKGVAYTRERLELADGDFLDLDWSGKGTGKLAIVTHGLEGSSQRHYVMGVVKAFNAAGWDALAWNCRSCSGEMNRLPRMYHHADTQDLATVVKHVLSLGKWKEIALIGFSMGGNITLKYLGEQGDMVSPLIQSAVAFSVPCDLPASVRHMHQPSNRFYERRFLRKLAKKIQAKAQMFPDLVDATGVEAIRHFKPFDDRYTAPLHGFKSADDFYQQASCGPYLASIRIPALLVQAQNDPFLPKECFPVEVAQASKYLYLEMPLNGGHVGFSVAGSTDSWAEQRAVDFVCRKKF